MNTNNTLAINSGGVYFLSILKIPYTGYQNLYYILSMDILREALANGILDLTVICKELDMLKRQEYLQKHQYKIYQNKDGRWCTYLPGRKRIQSKFKESLEDAIVSYYKSAEFNPTVSDIFREWNDRRVDLGKIKRSTATRFDHDFDKFFDALSNVRIKELTPVDISDFLEEQLIKYHLTHKAFANLKTLTKGILKRAKKLDLFPYAVDVIFSDLDVSDREFRRKIVDDSREIFYDDELDLIRAYCKLHEEDLSCLGVLLMYVTGLRVGEVVTLKPTDILNGEIYVHRTETQYYQDGKNHFEVSEYPKTPAGVRRVIVPDSYKWLLDRLRDVKTDYIFIGMHGKRMHTNQLRKRLYQICKKLDMPVRSPHKLRKTYGTILLDNHVDSKVIERQMGHVDISTTELHYHRDRKRTQQKRDIINSLAEFS